MACIVELTRPETCFDPEAVIILSASLEEAWNRLLRSGSECTRPAYARAMREVLAKRIFDLAQVSLTKKNLLMVRSVFWRRITDMLQSKGVHPSRSFATSQQEHLTRKTRP